MDWPADDQPFVLKTRSGPLLSIPYPAELNDSASIIHRHDNAHDFTQMIIDQFNEMIIQSKKQPLVMTISLHAFVMGQPFRIGLLRKALKHCINHPESNLIWWTTPGQIYDHCLTLPPNTIPGLIE